MLSLLSSCALKPPDAEVCVTLPSYEAYCANTISDKERTIGEEEWYSLQPGRFSLSAEEFRKYQSFVDEVCIRYECDKDQKKTQKELKKIMSKFTK